MILSLTLLVRPNRTGAVQRQVETLQSSAVVALLHIRVNGRWKRMIPS
jgi:hypothetical protein